MAKLTISNPKLSICGYCLKNNISWTEIIKLIHNDIYENQFKFICKAYLNCNYKKLRMNDEDICLLIANYFKSKNKVCSIIVKPHISGYKKIILKAKTSKFVEEYISIHVIYDVKNNSILKYKYAFSNSKNNISIDWTNQNLEYFLGILNNNIIQNKINEIIEFAKNSFNYTLEQTKNNNLIWKFDSNTKCYTAAYENKKYYYKGNKKTDAYGYIIIIENENNRYRCYDRDFIILNALISQINSLKNTTENIVKNNKSKTQNNIKKDKKTKYISVGDFIVRTTVNRCVNSEHNLIDVNAVVNIMVNGKMTEYKFPAMYCDNCNKYYIYEHIYKKMKTIGYICCKVIEYDDLINNMSNTNFNNWNSKSLLRMYGYTVEKNLGLNDKQRHNILSFLIENDIISSHKIIGHLQSCIALRKNMKHMNSAINKWKIDIDYVTNYQKTNIDVRVNKIFNNVSSMIYK